MIKVLGFSDDSFTEFEEQLNDFFSEAGETIELIDVKYAIVHESVDRYRHWDWRKFSCEVYSSGYI